MTRSYTKRPVSVPREPTPQEIIDELNKRIPMGALDLGRYEIRSGQPDSVPLDRGVMGWRSGLSLDGHDDG